MAEIKTRYSIGDRVYHPLAITGNRQIPCPDCLGERFWQAILPSGEETKIPCPTCSHGYEGPTGTVPEFTVTGKVQILTIGSIGFETHREESPIEYMCRETGTGSGSVWKERDLFATDEEAHAILPALISQKRIALEESQAASRSRKRLDGPGRMVSYYKQQIRAAKKELKQAERALARETGEPLEAIK